MIGGGIIGLSLSIELRRNGASVLIVERGEPGREASSAAGGMLVDCSAETLGALQPLATASASMYPEFVRGLEIDSGMGIDLRDQGTIFFPSPAHASQLGLPALLPTELAGLGPALAVSDCPAYYLQERSVDPRGLTSAALKAAKHRGVDISSGDEVTAVNCSPNRSEEHELEVLTKTTSFFAPKVVNCAGAWSGPRTRPEWTPPGRAGRRRCCGRSGRRGGRSLRRS